MGSRHRPEGAAEQGRDALARILYDRLFNFLVQRLNDASCADTSVALMGILDPPGAIKTDEDSPGNFQTLLRNFIHERMLHLFSNHMFTQQQTRMAAEGVVPLTDLEAPDVTGRLEMLERRGGLFSIVDEVQALPQAQPSALYTKLVSNLAGHPDFIASDVPSAAPGMATARHNLGFTLKHSFGDCFYNLKDFLDVDGDDSFNASLRALQGTGSSLLLQLFPALLTGDPFKYVSALRMTKSAMVRAQLASLKQMLNPAIVTFVHCINVNHPASGETSTFNMKLVQTQIEAMCVLPSILWQRFGYPISMSVEKCWDKYYMLCPFRALCEDNPWPDNNIKTAVMELLSMQPFEKHHWRIGETQVFLRPGPLKMLQHARETALHKAASTISSRLRKQRVFKFMGARKGAMAVLQPMIRGILTRQLYTRALECAFMSFSDRESLHYNSEVTEERGREKTELDLMAKEDAETREAWETIELAHNSENFNLCAMYEEGLRSQVHNANWKLHRAQNEREKEDEERGLEPAHVSVGNEVYAFDDPNHEQPGCSEIEGIKDIAMDALAEIASMTIDEIVKKAEEDRAFIIKEELMRDSNQSQMAAVDDYLHKVNEQLSKRKKMGPCAELAMMVDAENNQKIRIIWAKHAKMNEEIARIDEEAEHQSAHDHHRNAGQALFDLCFDMSKGVLESRLGADTDPTKIHAQDRLVAAQDTHMMVTDMIDSLIMSAEKQGMKMQKMRKAIEQTEVRKREIEKMRDAATQAMEEARIAEMQAHNEKTAAQNIKKIAAEKAKKAELERQRKEEEEARLDADGDGILDEPLSASPVVRALQLERRSPMWKKKQAKFEAMKGSPDSAVGLTRSQQSIENELQQLQGLLSMTENANEEDTCKLLNSSMQEQDNRHKYAFKYKFKALIVDDDSEMQQ